MNPSPAPGPLPAHPAHLGFRLLALAYDSLPLAALWLATAALALLLRGGTPAAPNSVAAWATFALLLLTSFGYFALSWRRGGQTLGMRAWRLRLVKADGSPCTDWRALALRCLVAGLSLGLFGLGFFWSLWERERRTWHDLASGTVLVRLPRSARARRVRADA